MGLVPSLGARLARLTFEPDLLLSDGEAYLLRHRRRGRGLAAVPEGARHGRPTWTATRGDGRQPARPVRQPEHLGHRPARRSRSGSCSGYGARRATPSTTGPATGCLGTGRGCSCRPWTWCPASGTTTLRARSSTMCTGWCRTWGCSTSAGRTTRCGWCRCTPA